jgi:flagellar biosynthesis GTPase FlhF
MVNTAFRGDGTVSKNRVGDLFKKKRSFFIVFTALAVLMTLLVGCGENSQNSDAASKSLSKRESVVRKKEASVSSRSSAEKASKEKEEAKQSSEKEASKKSEAEQSSKEAASAQSSSQAAAASASSQTQLVPRQAMFGQWADSIKWTLFVKDDNTMMLNQDGLVLYRGAFETRNETNNSITLVPTEMAADGLILQFVDQNTIRLAFGGTPAIILLRQNSWRTTDPLPNN